MEPRRDIRYNLEDAAALRQTVGDIRCRFEFNAQIEVILVDLSLRGFGYRIDAISGSKVDELKNRDNFLVTLILGNDAMAADVRNIWSNVFFDGGKMNVRGGVALEVMSAEDRLKLSGIIERIRGGR